MRTSGVRKGRIVPNHDRQTSSSRPAPGRGRSVAEALRQVRSQPTRCGSQIARQQLRALVPRRRTSDDDQLMGQDGHATVVIGAGPAVSSLVACGVGSVFLTAAEGVLGLAVARGSSWS